MVSHGKEPHSAFHPAFSTCVAISMIYSSAWQHFFEEDDFIILKMTQKPLQSFAPQNPRIGITKNSDLADR